jgi:hypothetical protein
LPRTVLARTGDTLCGLAIDAGFLDCGPLRAEAANSGLLARALSDGDLVTIPDLALKTTSKATDQRHKFVKKNSPPISVRFVHGSPDKKYLEDLALTVLNVSNFVTNQGGAAGNKPFPPGFGFNPDGHADVDAFKVEVVDPAASGSVDVLLEALRPVFNPDGSLKGHDPFAGVTDADKRHIDKLQCKQVRTGHVAFRSRYLRLVVDAGDHAAAPGQTLLTTDVVDDGDEAVEILDQKVRASYEAQRCPGTGGRKCRVTAELEVGENEQRVKIAAHVLQDPVTGTAVATIDQTRTSCLKYVRQLYAQANMSLRLVGTIRQVPAPVNMFAVADGNGQRAVGGQTIQVRVQVGTFDQQIQITTVPNALPIDTATTLADAINKAFDAATPPVTARAVPSDNPPLVGQALGSADVLIGNPLTDNVRLTVLASGDVGHPITVGRITSTTIPDFVNNNSHVGTIQERVLVKNFDTGVDRVDLFIVGGLGSTALGEAFIPNAAQAATRQPRAAMINSALVFAGTVTVKDNFHTTIPHEVGHILMDVNHAQTATEMMGAGSPVGANERVVNGPKRISDPTPPRAINFDSGQSGNPVTFLRNDNTTGIIDAF